jgi:hypothetical protein
MIGLTLNPSYEQKYTQFFCTVEDAHGRAMVSSGLIDAPDEGDELQLLVPTRNLRSGNYVLVVVPIGSSAGAAAEAPLRYPFALQ